MTIYANNGLVLSNEEIQASSPELQYEIMDKWFRKNFVNPHYDMYYIDNDHSLWYDDYQPELMLTMQFEGVVREEILDELVSKLLEESLEWAPDPSGEYYDADYFSDYFDGDFFDPHNNFSSAIHNINVLLTAPVPQNKTKFLYRLLYANVITVIETYLSDTFIKMIQDHHDLMHKFFENNPNIKIKTLSRSRQYCRSFSWQNIIKANEMYEHTLNVKFPDIEQINDAIKKRNHIIHRNGKDKDDNDINITEDDISCLIAVVEQFVENVEEQIGKLYREKTGHIDTPEDPDNPNPVIDGL